MRYQTQTQPKQVKPVKDDKVAKSLANIDRSLRIIVDILADAVYGPEEVEPQVVEETEEEEGESDE